MYVVGVRRVKRDLADISVVAGPNVLDGTANTSVAFSALAKSQVPKDGKTYDLCWVTGANGVASVHTHVIRTAFPDTPLPTA